MSASDDDRKAEGSLTLVTISVGDLLLGVDIFRLQEINRQLDITFVPHAPDSVRGVINLRGDVVTVWDLGAILGFERAKITDQSRNVIVTFEEERIGLLVDQVGDVVEIPDSEIELPPANFADSEAHYLSGIYKMEDELLGILNLEEVLT